jgi:short-subunit dehydrogenase
MRIGSQTVAVITGAAGGIGRALASELTGRGAAVALTDIDRAGLDAVAAASKRSSTHVCDMADPEAVHIVAKAVVAAHGAVHVLINNAGISVAGPVEELTLADFQLAMAVNFWGVVHSCRAFLPHLRAAAGRGEGAAVCNVLSDFALFSLPTKAAYAASKHAARALTESLGAELHGTGISVTAAYPGATATALVLRGHAVDEAKREREAEFLARGMRPETVARKIVQGVERGKARVLVGRDTRVIDAATRLAPGLFQAAVRRFWRRVPFL